MTEIREQIGALTFAPEIKRITFNGSQVREYRDTMEKLLAVAEAAQKLQDANFRAEHATGGYTIEAQDLMLALDAVQTRRNP